MGGFYGSIHVRTEDAEAVRNALQTVSAEAGTKFLLAPAINGWISVFPQDNGQDMGVSAILAEKIDSPLIHCAVHDDDILIYQFYESGKLVDSYNSCPDYFGGETAERGGNVELLKSILPEASKRKALKTLLDAEDYTFEMERLEKFAEVLGLPNAVTSYEYLQDRERDGIQQWKQFVHIPDRKAEQAAKRAAKAKAKAEMKQMAKDGLLVLEKVGQKTSHPLFHESPVWCIDPYTSEVLLVWAGEPIGPASLSRIIRVDAHSGREEPTGIEVSSRAHCMAASQRWIAVGCASGDWKTQIWNRADSKLECEIPQSRAVSQVCFGRDGQTLFSLSEKTITVVDLPRMGSTKPILLPGGGRAMALHPAGEHMVVVANGGTLMLVHLPTSKVLGSFWIPEPPGPQRDLLEYAASSGIEERFLKAAQGSFSMEDLEKARAEMSRHFLPKQGAFSVSFGTTGNYLFCGTNSGLCVLEWPKVLAVPDTASLDPLVLIPADPLTHEDGTPDNQLIYAVPADSVGKRLLFAGLEGKIRYASTADGRMGDLLVPPIRQPFWQLELTPDRTALVGTAIPKREGNKPAPQSFQIWNYKALCESAGLAW